MAQPEPARFNADVRIPGTRFVKRLRQAPTREEWKKHDYWKSCLVDLKLAYRDICAYTSLWLPDSSSVDHFEPKSTNPRQAYEWSNYRLASAKINNRKGNSLVLDPFTIGEEWFVLDLATSQIRDNPKETVATKARIQNTIRTLGLNDDNWVRMRFNILRDYSRQIVTMRFLEERYPFIARELNRQNMATDILGRIP